MRGGSGCEREIQCMIDYVVGVGDCIGWSVFGVQGMDRLYVLMGKRRGVIVITFLWRVWGTFYGCLMRGC